jgi:TolB-like protein
MPGFSSRATSPLRSRPWRERGRRARSPPPARWKPGARWRSSLFKDLSGNPENAHLGLGLADSTITELSLVKSLLVRPTAAILRYQDRVMAPEAAGRELGVDAVVNGSFQRSGSRLRVTVQLIATEDGRSLWGSKIDTSLDDIFQTQDEVSRRIAQALEVELSPSDERRLARAARPDGKAYEMYLKGRFHLLRETLADARAAIECFEKVGEADPGFALGWAGLSAACVRMGFSFDPEGEWLVRAEAAYEKALAIDAALPEGRFLKGLLLWTPRRGFDHAGAIREFLGALAGRPNPTDAHHSLGLVSFTWECSRRPTGTWRRPSRSIRRTSWERRTRRGPVICREPTVWASRWPNRPIGRTQLPGATTRLRSARYASETWRAPSAWPTAAPTGRTRTGTSCSIPCAA